MSEFNLSEKGERFYKPTGDNLYFNIKDVKELIKRLKCYDKNKLLGKDFIVISKKDLNKLAGNKLTGEGNE